MFADGQGCDQGLGVKCEEKSSRLARSRNPIDARPSVWAVADRSKCLAASDSVAGYRLANRRRIERNAVRIAQRLKEPRCSFSWRRRAARASEVVAKGNTAPFPKVTPSNHSGLKPCVSSELGPNGPQQILASSAATSTYLAPSSAVIPVRSRICLDDSRDPSECSNSVAVADGCTSDARPLRFMRRSRCTPGRSMIARCRGSMRMSPHTASRNVDVA